VNFKRFCAGTAAISETKYAVLSGEEYIFISVFSRASKSQGPTNNTAFAGETRGGNPKMKNSKYQAADIAGASKRAI
jgi:hypothetical protein